MGERESRAMLTLGVINTPGKKGYKTEPSLRIHGESYANSTFLYGRVEYSAIQLI
jgi:hypothetical protein